MQDSVANTPSSSAKGGLTPPRRVTAAGGGSGHGVASGGGVNTTHATRKSRAKSPVSVSSSKSATTATATATATTPLDDYASKVLSGNSGPSPSIGSLIFAEVKEIDALPEQSTKPSPSAAAPPIPSLRRHKSMWDVDDVLKVFRLGEGFQAMLHNLLQMNNQPTPQPSVKPSKKLHRPPSVQRNVAGSKVDDGQSHGARRSR